jgi:hypothetical protein
LDPRIQAISSPKEKPTQFLNFNQKWRDAPNIWDKRNFGIDTACKANRQNHDGKTVTTPLKISRNMRIIHRARDISMALAGNVVLHQKVGPFDPLPSMSRPRKTCFGRVLSWLSSGRWNRTLAILDDKCGAQAPVSH